MSVNIDSLGSLSLLLLFLRLGSHLWFKFLLASHCWQHESLINESRRFLRFLIFVKFESFTKSKCDLWALDRFLEFDVNIFLLSCSIQVHS